MKVTLNQVVNSQEVFQKLLSEKFPIKLAYQIQKNFRAIEPELKQYESTRQGLITGKYGTKQEDGNWKVETEQMEDYVKELTDLLSLEINFDFNKVKLPDTYEMTSGEVYVLEWFLNFDEDELPKEHTHE